MRNEFTIGSEYGTKVKQSWCTKVFRARDRLKQWTTGWENPSDDEIFVGSKMSLTNTMKERSEVFQSRTDLLNCADRVCGKISYFIRC